MEPVEMPISRLMDKENVVSLHNGVCQDTVLTEKQQCTEQCSLLTFIYKREVIKDAYINVKKKVKKKIFA